MIKKLITISVFLSLGLTLGLVGTAGAAWNDVQYTANTATGIQDMTIGSGAKVESIVIGTSTVTVTLATNSVITFNSAGGRVMTLDHPIATNVCHGDDSASLTLAYDAVYPTVIVSLAGTLCGTAVAPTISSVAVTDSTHVSVTFSKDIAYLSDAATFKAATCSFGGTAIDSSSISGNVLTLTFASALTGIKDDSYLVLPAQIRDADDISKVVTAVTTQVVTDLATINQLYDFVFAIQTGDNFMSVPFDVVGPDGTAVSTEAKVGLTYVVPNGAIYTYTIGDAGYVAGAFANAAAFEVLYGYYINSTATTTPVYLRLNKASSQSLTFERTFSAAGWHMIGVASNLAKDSAGLETDDDLLSAMGTNYDTVVDLSTHSASAGNLDDTLGNGTYDNVNSIYEALYDAGDIVASTRALIELAAAASGVEFNHGESYFVYITAQNTNYIGSPVGTTQLQY